MRKRIFKYDDNHKYFVISIVVSLVFLYIAFYLDDIYVAYIIGIIISAVVFVGALIIYLTGIHFDYKKNKITILDSLGIRTISISEVKYISIEELVKTRKARRGFLSPDSRYGAFWTFSSKYVYRNGKTYKIIFHMKNDSIVESYYGWLFNSKTNERVVKQENKFNQMIKEIMEFKKYR
jgi:hypothetical protein